ncbi:unnamed protein product [Prorocentrum cordatum]|uniref:Uncharacterized protein n=1 Tax=Prorocentrum cordatum TaxID=2364126 RepID=A0ABN9X4T1_9DINO|nr:unnamed protein product [Polarella glacialis]
MVGRWRPLRRPARLPRTGPLPRRRRLIQLAELEELLVLPLGLGCDGQADGAARRRRGPRRPRAKAAAELSVALAVAVPAVGGAAASVVGPEEVFLVADGFLRQAADCEPRLSEQLRQMLGSVSWRPAGAL